MNKSDTIAKRAANTARMARWRHANCAYVTAYAKTHNANHYHQYRQALDWYKTTQTCADCGETDPIVLQFDHLPEYEKSFDLGVRHSLKAAWVEIQKCDVVCANCHRRRTHSRAMR